MNASFTNLATLELTRKLIGSKVSQRSDLNSLQQTDEKSPAQSWIQLAPKPADDEHTQDVGISSRFPSTTSPSPRLQLDVLLQCKGSKSTNCSRSTALPLN